MVICRLSVDIRNNEPILKLQCKIQDIEGMLRIYQLKFDSGIEGIDVLDKLLSRHNYMRFWGP